MESEKVSVNNVLIYITFVLECKKFVWLGPFCIKVAI